jgi:hypothetical protein
MSQGDFHLKRVTQSQYRGGNSRLGPDNEDVFSKRTIPPINFQKKDDRKQLKEKIIERTDVVLKSVLSEKTVASIKKSDYLDDIYKQIGL